MRLLLEASEFVAGVQRRQGFYIAAIEEIAYRMGYIDAQRLYELGKEMENTEWRYLKVDKGSLTKEVSRFSRC